MPPFHSKTFLLNGRAGPLLPEPLGRDTALVHIIGPDLSNSILQRVIINIDPPGNIFLLSRIKTNDPLEILIKLIEPLGKQKHSPFLIVTRSEKNFWLFVPEVLSESWKVK